MTLDTLILDGIVVDGTGRPGYQADVGIHNGLIAAIGPLSDAEAALRIHAAGCVVAPGFIDIHTHSDVTLLDDPGGESKAHQGVTTEVIGNCGFSPFPCGQVDPKHLQAALSSILPSQKRWEWNDLDGWANSIENNGVSLNVAPLVGHATLRVAVGLTDNRPPAPDELIAMQRLATATVEQGAFGLSTGLTLPPSSYAATEELIALADAVSSYQGVFYATHARVWAGCHVRAVEEAVEVGRCSGLPVQYAHMAIIDSRAFGRGEELVGVVERAHEEGIDITYDVYPYTAAGTPLSQLIPGWVQEGGTQAMLRRLGDPSLRKRAAEEIGRGWFGGLPWEWDKLVISDVGSERNRDLVGCSLAEIAATRQMDPVEVLLMLIEQEHNLVRAVMHNRLESDMRFFLRHSQAMVGSDGRAISLHGAHAASKPHPRFYGTYPRILGRYVRDEPILDLETAIYKMTGFPARRLGLRDRGHIAEGFVADLVVFDPRTVKDRATFESPHQYPEGITHVFVSGKPVIIHGRHTGARPGRVLRRGI